MIQRHIEDVPVRHPHLFQSRREGLRHIDPFALGRLGRLLANVVLDLGKRVEHDKRLPDLAERSAERVYVRLEQARQHHPTLQIDHLRLRTALLSNDVGRSADGQDAPRPHRHRLGNAEGRIHRYHLPAGQDQIGLGRRDL